MNFIQLLSGGDRRSIGQVDRVVKIINEKPKYFDTLFNILLSNDDPLLRMRAADAIEKITQQHPEYLKKYKKQLLNIVAPYKQQEVRWHVAQIIPRLALTKKEKSTAIDLLMQDYLKDKSSIVKTSALQALTDLALQDSSLISLVKPIIKKSVQTGTPAMRSRGKKLLELLRKF